MVNHQSTESLYQVLGVGVDATQEELKRAYRRKAALVHPDKVIHENRERATQEFQRLSHAFGVLSDPEKRKFYDFTPSADSGSHRKKAAYGNQSPKGSLQQIFKDFFDGGNFPSGLSAFNDSTSTYSFESCWSHQQSSTFYPGAQGLFSSNSSASSNFSTAAATKDRELPLTLTLEEVLRGGEKDLTITRRLADGVSGRLIQVDEAVPVQLTPGIREGTRIVLRGRGDESPGRGCSDIVLVVREALHPRFERRGNDLFTCLSVPLVQALTADSILVPTLHGDHVPVALSRPITPETVLRAPGKGMPVPEEPGRSGDLCVRFRITFPRTLTPTQKHQLHAALQ